MAPSTRAPFSIIAQVKRLRKFGKKYFFYSRTYVQEPSQPTPAAGYDWKQLLYPYVKSTGVYQCPSNSNAALDAGPLATIPTDYHINPYVGQGTVVSGVGWFPIYETKIWAPTTTVLLNEASSNNLCYALLNGTPGVMQDYEWAGHLDKANFLFCDGHVKMMSYGGTVLPNNMWYAWGPTPDNIGFGTVMADGNTEFVDTAQYLDTWYATNNKP